MRLGEGSTSPSGKLVGSLLTFFELRILLKDIHFQASLAYLVAVQ
jgi:hypothetical protein